MGVDQSRGRLQHSYKELMARWEEANAFWDDRVSREFNETYLEPLEPRIRATMEAMEDMSELLRKIKRQCG